MNVAFVAMDMKTQLPWAQSVLGVKWCEDTQGIVAIDRDTQAPLGLCVMDSWTHTSVQIHIAIMRPMVLRHGFLEEIADHVFNRCGRDIMIGLVPSNHEKALKLDKHIGFTETYRVKDGFDRGIDYVVMELRREDCRWLKNDGQESTRSA